MTVEEALEFGRMVVGVDLEIDELRKAAVKMIPLGKRLDMGSEFIYMSYMTKVKRDGVIYSQVCALRLCENLETLYNLYMGVKQDIIGDEQRERFLGWCKQVIYTLYVTDSGGDYNIEYLISTGEEVIEEIYGAGGSTGLGALVINMSGPMCRGA